VQRLDSILFGIPNCAVLERPWRAERSATLSVRFNMSTYNNWSYNPVPAANWNSVSGCVYVSSAHRHTIPYSQGKKAVQGRISNRVQCSQWGLTLAQHWWRNTMRDIQGTYLRKQQWELAVVTNDACWSQKLVVDVAERNVDLPIIA